MRTYDMIQELLEIQSGVNSQLEALQCLMGPRCGFLNVEQKRLNNLVTELQADHDRYRAERIKT